MNCRVNVKIAYALLSRAKHASKSVKYLEIAQWRTKCTPCRHEVLLCNSQRIGPAFLDVSHITAPTAVTHAFVTHATDLDVRYLSVDLSGAREKSVLGTGFSVQARLLARLVDCVGSHPISTLGCQRLPLVVSNVGSTTGFRIDLCFSGA